MKKIVKYLVAAIAMVAAVSCQKELVEEKAPVKDGDSYVFTASLKPATKTVLNIDEETGVMKSQWWAGVKNAKEYINVMDDSEVNNKYASPALSAAADKVDFTLDEGSDFYGKEVFAVYPYNEKNKYWKGDEDAIGVVAYFAETQIATAGTYDPTAPVHVAYNADITASTNLVFSNLSALLKFTVTDQFIRTITFSGLDYEQVSGSIVYKYNDGKYTVEDKGDGSYEVTLKAAEGRYFEVGTAYYLSVVPGTFEKGVQVVLNKELGEDENMKTYVHPQPVTLLAGTINDFGAFKTQGNLTWGVAEFGATTDVEDLELNEAGYFAGTVSLEAGKTYMLRASDEWYTESNYGLSFPREAVTVGKYALGTYDVEKEVSAAYGIRVAQSGEYDILFSPSGKLLYLLDKGAAADEDLDLSKVATPDPVRSITGSFVGGAERIAMTAVKDSKGNTTHFEAVVEFLSTDEDRALYLRDGSSNLITYGCDADEFEFKDGVSFASVVNGDDIVVPDPETDEETGEPVAESVYYVVEQSYDGMTITITTPDTPDGAQWAFELEQGISIPSVMDFGYTFDGFTWAVDVDTYSLGQAPEAMSGLYMMNDYQAEYKFVPTSFTSGQLMNLQYNGDWGVYMTYTDYDGDSFKATSANMMIAEADVVLSTDVCEFYIPNSPVGKQVIVAGEPVMVLDFGCTLPKQMAVGELAFGKDEVPYACYYGDELVGSAFIVDYSSPTSGVITCTIPGMARAIDITFEAPAPSMIILTNESMGWKDAACEMISGEDALEFMPPYVPEAAIDGEQWVGTFVDADEVEHTYLLDLGYTFKDKLVFAELVDGAYQFILEEEYTTEGNFELFFAETADDFFMFEIPEEEEFKTGYVYNVYNDTYFGADVPVEFVIYTGDVAEPFDTPDLKQWNYTIGDDKAMLDLGTAVLGGYFGNEVEDAFTADNMWMPEVTDGDEVITPAGWYQMSTNVFKYSVKPNSSTDGVINVEGVWYPDEETFDSEGNAELILLEQTFEVPYKDYDGKSVKIYFPTDGSYYECVLAEEASETITFSMGVM